MKTRGKRPAVLKKGRTAKRIAVLVLLLCTGAAAYFGALSARELLERREGSAFYGALATEVRTSVSGEDAGAAIREGKVGGASARSVQPKSAVNFEALRDGVPDVVGWISLEESVIDYPIVQGEDNAYYLRHLPDGTANEMGSIMMDAACDPGFQSEVTILHGHHMRSGAMFGNLEAYRDEAYFRAHPMMRLCTPRGDYDVAVIAAHTVDGNGYGYPTAFADAGEFDRFVRMAASASAFEANVEAVYGDRLLVMSTCAYAFESARFVVVGKIMDIPAPHD